MEKDQRKLLILSSLGGILEFYDFIIFALFAGYIANAFFPSSNELFSLLIAFATSAIGYLSRPIGGMIFGHFGDRLGRKATFTISILIMAFATLGIGLVPSYANLGFTAPILVIFLRILQGLSVGGEIPGAITYISESFSHHKGLACGVIFCAILFGIVLGSLVDALIVTVFSETQMYSFGWRIPFILGGLFGILSYLLRKNLHESPQFIAIEKKIEKFPVLTVFKTQLVTAVAGTFITALCAVIITVLFLFIPAYFSKVLHFSVNSYVWERTLMIGLGAILCVFFGYLTDRIFAKRLTIILSVITALLAYPIFIIYVTYPQLYLISFICSAILLGASAGIIPRLLSEIYPTSIRYSGIAVSYNFGFAIFGGLTPFISLSLIYYTEQATIPALYIIGICIAALISLLCIQQKYNQDN